MNVRLVMTQTQSLMFTVCDHVKQLAAGENLVEDFGKRCKDEEDVSIS